MFPMSTRQNTTFNHNDTTTSEGKHGDDDDHDDDTLDLDELFADCYFDDMTTLPILTTTTTNTNTNTTTATTEATMEVLTTSTAIDNTAPNLLPTPVEITNQIDSTATEHQQQQQQQYRRARNREHAKKSRLRKKFLLESLQDQIDGLKEQLEMFRTILQEELPPDQAKSILDRVLLPNTPTATTTATTEGGEEPHTASTTHNPSPTTLTTTSPASPSSTSITTTTQYKPLPIPSGFVGPMKTIWMEPDFRLMNALQGSQQNFTISDPTLPDNPIVYVSQGFLNLTGYTMDQVLGRNCRFLQGLGTDPSAVQDIRRAIQNGQDGSVCLLNYKADGTPFWNQFFVAALRDANQQVVNYVGVQCEVSKAVVQAQSDKAQQKRKRNKIL